MAQGKQSALCSRPLAYALDKLTKNQLIDFAADMARRTLGESATDDEILAWLQDSMGPIWAVRGDKAASLQSAYCQFRTAAERYQQANS